MQKRMAAVAALVLLVSAVYAQSFIGPVLGPVSFRSASIWVSTGEAKAPVKARVWPAGKKAAAKDVTPQVLTPNGPYHIVRFDFNALEPGSSYEYEVTPLSVANRTAAGGPQSVTGRFTTQTLFQWRQPAPDFSFLTGSCAYFNEPAYDRPGKPYGGDSSIFETMAKEQAAFMLWLGDNWYTRDVDYSSAWGLWYRAIRDRSMPVLQNFWRSMGHLAIWDDHDYGPNDYGSSYHLKHTSREVFQKMWMNPSTGDGQQGVYTRYTYADVDFFMLDDRWWRSYDRLPDSVNGQPNTEKQMMGRQQLEWLKNELRYSKSNPHVSFRIISIGSQVLNPGSPFDKLLDFPTEYNDLISFIRAEKIDGVLFLTGDRHHSEIIKVQHPGLYPLYDITCSPLTSGTHSFNGKEANNPWRILGIDKLQNYGRISISGGRSNRSLRVEFVGIKGEKLGEWTVNEKELRF